MIRYLAQMVALIKNEEGQGMVEYALIIGGIAIVAMIAINALGGGVGTLFTKITTSLAAL